MSFIYRFYDYIIDEQFSEFLNFATDLSRTLDCNIKIVQDIAAVISPDGFEQFRLVTEALDEATAQQFSDSITQKFKVTKSGQTDHDYFEKHLDQLDVDPLVGLSWIDGILEVIKWNKQLAARLQNEKPYYFEYDWTLPFTITMCHSWLENIVSAANRLSIGCELRMGQVSSKNDHHYQQLVLRVFEHSEFRYLLTKANLLATDNEWRTASVEVFREASPMQIELIDNYLQKVVKPLTEHNNLEPEE